MRLFVKKLRELTSLSSRIRLSKAKTKRKGNAPTPIHPVGGTTSAEKHHARALRLSTKNKNKNGYLTREH